MIDVALTYLQAGLCVLPADLQAKRPTLKGWKSFQSHRPIELQVRQRFGPQTDAICIVTGTISGNLEVLDFDCEASQFEDWVALIPPEIIARLVMERSQSGGRHVIYRCATPVCGSMKLSQIKRPDKIDTLIEDARRRRTVSVRSDCGICARTGITDGSSSLDHRRTGMPAGGGMESESEYAGNCDQSGCIYGGTRTVKAG